MRKFCLLQLFHKYLDWKIYFELSKSIIFPSLNIAFNIFSAHAIYFLHISVCCVVSCSTRLVGCPALSTVGGRVVWNSPKADENVRWFPRSPPRTITHFRNAGRILTWIKLLKRDQKQLPSDVFVTKNRSHSSFISSNTFGNNIKQLRNENSNGEMRTHLIIRWFD